MFQRILVPLDGSKRAERAIPVAARIARASGGSITFLRVVTSSIEFVGYPMESPTLVQEALETELIVATEYLAGIARSKQLEGIATKTDVRTGITALTILSAADEQDSDLIVMCSHGYTGLKRWMLGSVAQKVARHSQAPVFILREDGPIPAGLHPDPTCPIRALVPLDGSALAMVAVATAASLVTALAAPTPRALHLTRVINVPHTVGTAGNQVPFDPILREQMLSRAKRYLRTVTNNLRNGPIGDLKPTITWSVADSTDVAEALIRVAENGEDVEGAGIFGGCDLIAMATHGRSGLQLWTMGSITERVLEGTRLPVLVVRPQEAEIKQKVNGREASEIELKSWVGVL
jgi:nucleotide-binding universal stress UspA family protein